MAAEHGRRLPYWYYVLLAFFGILCAISLNYIRVPKDGDASLLGAIDRSIPSVITIVFYSLLFMFCHCISIWLWGRGNAQEDEDTH